MEPQAPVRQDLTHGDVVMWALGVMLAWIVVSQQVLLFVPHAGLIVLAGIELPVYLGACALFAARRPGQSFEELFAFRRVPVALLATGLLLGAALQPPAEKLEELVVKFFPLSHEVSEEMASQLAPHNVPHAMALVLVVAVLGPFVEELLYRGALFTGLRLRTTAVSAAITTGLLFTLVHREPRWWLPIALLAGLIGYLRARTGSLWPGLFLHGAFNGSTLVLAWAGPRYEELCVAPKVVAASSVLAIALVVLLGRLARTSSLVERARAQDGTHPTGDGAIIP